MPIKIIHGRQIYDAIGNPTIEVDIATEIGVFRSAVPNTDKTLPGELTQFKDHIPHRHHGLGVLHAIKNINNIIGPEMIKENFEVTEQQQIDEFLINLDHTEDRSRFGANALMAVSMAVAEAGAAKKGIPLYVHLSDMAHINAFKIPVPHLVILTGGEDSENKLPFKEYCVMPTGTLSFEEGMRCGTDIYREAKLLLETRYGKNAVLVADNGGLNAPFVNHRDAMFFLAEIIWRLNYSKQVEFSINAAASVMYKEGNYDVDFKNPYSVSSDYLSAFSLANAYEANFKDFGVVSIEDPFASEDWEAWKVLTSTTQQQYIANEFTQTNLKRIKNVVKNKAADTVVIKLNQCSTVTEIMDIFKLVKLNGFGVMVEGRVGDTGDLFLADLAVATAAGQVHCGAPCRGEHVGKLNRILRIEQEIGALSKYAGYNYQNVCLYVDRVSRH